MQKLSAPIPRPTVDLSKTPPGGRYDQIGVIEMGLIIAIASRAQALAQQWRIGCAANAKDQTLEANPTIVQLDIATVYLLRSLDLRAFLQANALDFISEHAAIQRAINRPLQSFPDDVALRFAQRGARLAT